MTWRLSGEDTLIQIGTIDCAGSVMAIILKMNIISCWYTRYIEILGENI